LDVARELTKSRDMPTRAALAKNHMTPLEILEILARDSQWTVAKAVLGAKVNRKITLSRVIFETIARHKRHTVRQSAAEHFLCPPDLLDELSRDAAPEVRSSVADHPKATPELLHRLASDTELRVVWNVATHINTSNETLNLLAQHPNSHTREKSIYPYLGFSRTREIPVTRLEMLKNDPDPEVQKYVLWNKFTPTWLVEEIFTNHPIMFEVDCGFYLNGQTVYGSHGAMGLEHVLRDHPNLNSKWLERMAQIDNPSLVRGVFTHPNVTPEILDFIAQKYLLFLEQNANPTDLLQAELIKRAQFVITQLTEQPKLSLDAQQKIIAGVQKTILMPYSIEHLLASVHQAIQNAMPNILEATRVNHMARDQPVSKVFYDLAELTKYNALSIQSQQQILEIISSEPPLHSSVIYRLEQSPHSLVKTFLQGIP
jgi:hypothetical protein